MIIVGLTGGIGSGKTTVVKMFANMGVPVYIADDEAKKLMNTSKIIKRKLIGLFGEETYVDGKLNKPFIANIIFNDKVSLRKMNAIVHPRVAKHFERWVLKQDAPYVIKEVAILFENGSYKDYDFVITVTANKVLRIDRLLKRDNTTKENIEAIMKNQWTDDQRIQNSDFVINNLSVANTKKQVVKIHKEILNRIGASKF
ncbi:MAG: dephospho-CoA kinase [Tamlana sp.]